MGCATASDSEDYLSTATWDSAAQLGSAALIATPDTAATAGWPRSCSSAALSA